MTRHGRTAEAEWSAAAVALDGQAVCGDAFVVCELPSATVVAVADGLGHGPMAAAAAETATETLRLHSDLPLEQIFLHCHEALRMTRGAALTITRIDHDGVLTWAAVGDVTAVLVPAADSAARTTVVPRGGVLGYRLPTVRLATHRVRRGDLIALATDGIRPSFVAELRATRTAAEVTSRVVEHHRHGDDDALALLARIASN